jgi:hypothetical protein
MRKVFVLIFFQLSSTSAICGPDTSSLFYFYTAVPAFIGKNEMRSSQPWYEIPADVFSPSESLELGKLLASCDLEQNVSNKIKFLKELERTQNYKFKLIVLDRFNTKPIDIYIEYYFNGTLLRKRFVRGAEACRNLTSFFFKEGVDVSRKIKDKQVEQRKRLLDRYK